MAFSPDGATLAVGMPLLEPEPVRLLDADNPRRRRRPLPGLTIATARDVRRLYLDRAIDLAWSTGTARRWRPSSTGSSPRT